MWYCKLIKDLMKQWKNEAGIHTVILYNVKHEKNEYDDSDYTLEICTNRPGPMIGMMGARVDKYRNLISDKIKHRVFVKFVETIEIA